MSSAALKQRSAARDPRRRDLATIHALQKALGMTDDDATALKLTLTGVASSAGMSYEQRARLINHLQRLRQRQLAVGHAIATPPGVPRKGRPTPSADAAPLVRKIRAQLISLGRLPDTYADGIARQMLGVDAPNFFEWCTPRQLHTIAQALAVEQRRKGAATR